MAERFTGLILQQLNLPKNMAKGGWEETTPFGLVERGIEEMEEISEALQDFYAHPTAANKAHVLAECGDVGAFAAMIADNVSRMKACYDQIRERAALELTNDDYRRFTIADIAQLRMDIKRLLRLIDQPKEVQNDR